MSIGNVGIGDQDRKRGMNWLRESIYERDFLNFLYGFHP